MYPQVSDQLSQVTLRPPHIYPFQSTIQRLKYFNVGQRHSRYTTPTKQSYRRHKNVWSVSPDLVPRLSLADYHRNRRPLDRPIHRTFIRDFPSLKEPVPASHLSPTSQRPWNRRHPCPLLRKCHRGGGSLWS